MMPVLLIVLRKTQCYLLSQEAKIQTLNICKAAFMLLKANTYLIIWAKYSGHGCKRICTAARCKSSWFLKFISFYSLTVIDVNIPWGTLMNTPSSWVCSCLCFASAQWSPEHCRFTFHEGSLHPYVLCTTFPSNLWNRLSFSFGNASIKKLPVQAGGSN